MQRIEQLLQKLTAMAAKGDKNELIDIDLMLDHVKAIYAELLELRDELTLGDIEEEEEIVADEELKEEEVNDENEEEYSMEEVEEEEEVEVEEEEEEEEAEEAGEVNQQEVQKGEAREPVQEPAIVEIMPTAAKTNAHYTPPSRDIRSVIGINDKYLFINELFGNNIGNYENTLDELNKLPNYDAAMEWLNENVLFVNENEDNAEIAQNFYDTINAFFSDK